jgi:glycopeptide antibiotics resistance protein
LTRYLLLLYLVLLFWLLVVARVPGHAAVTFSWLPFSTTFHTIAEIINFYPVHPHLIAMFWQQTLGNALLFVPWGILAPVCFASLRPVWSLRGAAFGLSLSFECLQYGLRLGMFDIDDLIFNLLGAIVGQKAWQLLPETGK